MDRGAAAAIPCDIRDPALAEAGRRRIEWAAQSMPVLRAVRKQFIREQPFAGARIAACLHCTAETANLLIALRDGGGLPVLCASSPVSTQDDVAASLVRDFHIPVFAVRGATAEVVESHRAAALESGPSILLDSGAELTANLVRNGSAGVVAATEETSAGAARLRALARSEALPFPVVSTHDAPSRGLFENHYGTGQSTMDTIIRRTGVLVAGMNVVVSGYGPSGRGVAARARGLGANVLVTEVDPARALQAAMDGCRVLPMAEAASVGDIFITVTGSRSVLGREAFDRLRDGAILCNAGHSHVEIDVSALERASTSHREVRESVEEFKMRDGRRIYMLAGGRIVNVAAAEGQPAAVMDVSFVCQALAAEYLLRHHTNLPRSVHSVPESIDRQVARMKLEAMGVVIDKLTIEQEQYLASGCEII